MEDNERSVYVLDNAIQELRKAFQMQLSITRRLPINFDALLESQVLVERLLEQIREIIVSSDVAREIAHRHSLKTADMLIQLNRLELLKSENVMEWLNVPPLPFDDLPDKDSQ